MRTGIERQTDRQDREINARTKRCPLIVFVLLYNSQPSKIFLEHQLNTEYWLHTEDTFQKIELSTLYFSIILLLLWNPHLMFSLNFLGNYEPKRVSAASSSLCTHRDTDNTAVSTRPNSAKGPGERESLRAHNGASVLKGGVLSRSREVKNRSE